MRQQGNSMRENITKNTTTTADTIRITKITFSLKQTLPLVASAARFSQNLRTLVVTPNRFSSQNLLVIFEQREHIHSSYW